MSSFYMNRCNNKTRADGSHFKLIISVPVNPSFYTALLTYAQPGLPAACSAETQPERWRTDHEWQLSQHTAKTEREGEQLSERASW